MTTPSSPTQLQRRIDAWLQYQSRGVSYDFLLRDFLSSTFAYDSLSKEALLEISEVFAEKWKEWVDTSPRRKRKKLKKIGRSRDTLERGRANLLESSGEGKAKPEKFFTGPGPVN